MRAKLAGVLIAAAVALSLCLTCYFLVNHVADRTEDLAMQALDQVDQGRLEKARETMTQLASEWERYRPFLEMLISHDEMHTVVERYVEAEINLDRGHLDDYYRTMSLLREILRHIREQERVGWGNVL